MEHREDLECLADWRRYFPFPTVWENQGPALETIFRVLIALLELPTGTGKTAVGYTFLKTLLENGIKGALLYITPTKTLVDQVKELHPEVKVVYGRNEYPCLYYKEKGKKVQADQAPCSLIPCPHRVTSLTELPEKPCPYYLAKAEAEKGGIVACTTAFYLINKLFLNWPSEIAGLVLDEVHQIAKVARMVFKYDITDYHLKRVIELLAEIDPRQAANLGRFLEQMTKIAQLKPARQPTLLEPHEIDKLLVYLKRISLGETREKISQAVRLEEIDPVKFQEELKTLETIGRDLSKYITSFSYALKTEKRNPLNYIFAYYEKRIPKRQKIKYKLCVRAHYVAPLIRSSLRAERIIAYSATIGDPKIFGFETGVQFPFWTFPSTFPVANARIFLPNDTPNLAKRSRKRLDLYRALKMVAEATAEFKKENLRSLVVVVSEKERQKFLKIAKSLGVDAVSYGNGTSPRESAISFRNGKGDILVGTAANYSYGIDLPYQPHQIAPVIFFLRPSYPKPNDPATQFEERRFGKKRWGVWNWRAAIEARQVRGRNIRSAEDLGVAYFISQQFPKFLPTSFPEWLQEAWRAGKPMKEQVKEAIEFFKGG